MKKNLVEALIFGILYVVVGILMESILKIEDPPIYAMVYCLLGLTYGIL